MQDVCLENTFCQLPSRGDKSTQNVDTKTAVNIQLARLSLNDHRKYFIQREKQNGNIQVTEYYNKNKI